MHHNCYDYCLHWRFNGYRSAHFIQILHIFLMLPRNSSEWALNKILYLLISTHIDSEKTQALPVDMWFLGYVILPLSPNVAMPQFVIIGPPLMPVMRRVIGSWKEIGWWRGRRWNCSQIDPDHAITHWAN